MFKRFLALAFEEGLDAQIHIVSRGSPGCYGIVQSILEEYQKSYPGYSGEILLHSFSGSAEQFRQLKKACPRVVVGVSYLNMSSKGATRVVQSEHQCRLESDYDGSAPYSAVFPEEIERWELD